MASFLEDMQILREELIRVNQLLCDVHKQHLPLSNKQTQNREDVAVLWGAANQNLGLVRTGIDKIILHHALYLQDLKKNSQQP